MTNALPEVSVTDMKVIARAVRRAVLTRYDVDSCIESTAIFIDVLSELGVESSPAPVLVSAFNRAAQHMLTYYPDVPVEHWPEEAWSVGQGPDQPPKPGGWPGHLVAVVPTRAATRLVDVSADQMSRPEKDLVVPGPVIGRIPTDWGSGVACATHLHDTGTVVRWVLTEDTSWAGTLAWAGASQMTRSATLLADFLTDPAGDTDHARADALRVRGECADECVDVALADLSRAGIEPGSFTPAGA